jgi:hypothetical protein
MEFGINAKQTIFDKGAAYDLARSLDVHLSEHGGTEGGGVIGALAATGLRYSATMADSRGGIIAERPDRRPVSPSCAPMALPMPLRQLTARCSQRTSRLFSARTR